MKKLMTISLIALMSFSFSAVADESFKDVANDYLDFATYSEGVVTAAQLNNLGLDNVTLINTSSDEGYKESFIPGSIHIDWREVLQRSDEIPTDGLVVVYCKNTLVSAKAQLILSLAGYDNVKVLSRGYEGWLEFQRKVKS